MKVILKPGVLFKQVADGLMPMLDKVFDECLSETSPPQTRSVKKNKRQAQAQENMDKRKKSELEVDSSPKFKNVMHSNVSWY